MHDGSRVTGKPLRYGNRSFASMYRGIKELRQAIRAHDPEATEAAWDRVEEFVDVVFVREGV